MIRTFLAPAKINLYLQVIGRRPDGYHELSMIMQRVSLYDRISISLVQKEGVRVRCDELDLAAGEENIAAKAARLIMEVAGDRRGVEIAIDKQIPVAAGLGGGSSDAATVLAGLNDMLGVGLSREELMKEGVRLGADVPFFIFEDTAWASGIGDVLQKIEGLPKLWYVLVNPGISVSTAWVYQNLGLTSKNEEAKLPGFSRTAEGVVHLLRNDLEQVTVSRYPLIKEIKSRLASCGAVGTLMSGSGPTVFGVFEQEDVARRACAKMAETSGWRSFVVSSVD